MRYIILAGILFGLAVFGIAGLRGSKSRRPPIEVFPDMDRQPKLRPQTVSTFPGFTDQMSSRLPVEGTVARGSHYQAIPENTGMIAGTTNYVETIPVPVTAELMARGQERFGIYCSPCHGAQGDGKGITSKYGMITTKSLHDPAVVPQADGQIFDTITNGRNTMGAYGGMIPSEDRWAIVAYVRALQRSRLGDVNDVPEALRGNLKK